MSEHCTTNIILRYQASSLDVVRCFFTIIKLIKKKLINCNIFQALSLSLKSEGELFKRRTLQRTKIYQKKTCTFRNIFEMYFTSILLKMSFRSVALSPTDTLFSIHHFK